MKKLLLPVFVSILAVFTVAGQSPPTAGAEISVDAANVLNSCSPWLYGSCIEDVNHEIYGGLYGQRLYGESFEEPAPPAAVVGWTAHGGEWQPAGPSLSVKADAGAKFVRQQPQFADGSVEFDLRFSAPTSPAVNAGAIVRVQNAGVGADAFDGYEISLASDGRSLVLGRHQQNFASLQTRPVSVDPSQWQHLRVTLAGPRIQVYLNGSATPTVDYTDANPLPTGAAGLRTWGANVEFRNFQSFAGGQQTNGPFVAAPTVDVSGQWDPIQTGAARAAFSLDSAQAFNGSRSQRVQHTGGAGSVGVANRGLNRWGVAVKKGGAYTGRLYLRASQLQGPVTVSLQSADGARTYASQKLPAITGGAWTKFPFAFTSSADDPNARFAITIDAPGTLWIDQAVLLEPAAGRFRGLPVRGDIADAVTAGGISFLRYGGTAVNVPEYRWKKMIGDPDKRPPYRGNWHPYTSNGFGIEEFVAFSEAAGIAPAFAVNVEETPQDMADMVEYLNGATTTPQGSLRAANGRPKPYGVKYIELGNEEVIGGDNAADYDHYVERFKLLAVAMHQVDPNLLLVNAAWWRGDNPNCQRVFKALEGIAAYWDFHVWSDNANSGQEVGATLAEAQRLFQQWVPGAKMKVVIFEENGQLHNFQRALGHATTLNAVRRHGDFVLIDCAANGLQPWRQNDNGWDQGQIFFTPSQVWGMPPYYAGQMAAAAHQPFLVASQIAEGTNLDVTVTKSADGRTLCLHVVNLASAPSATRLRFANFPKVSPAAKAWTLSGNLADANSPDTPVKIQPAPQDISNAGNDFSYTFPAQSYTVLRLNAAPPTAN